MSKFINKFTTLVINHNKYLVQQSQWPTK